MSLNPLPPSDFDTLVETVINKFGLKAEDLKSLTDKKPKDGFEYSQPQQLKLVDLEKKITNLDKRLGDLPDETKKAYNTLKKNLAKLQILTLVERVKPDEKPYEFTDELLGLFNGATESITELLEGKVDPKPAPPAPPVVQAPTPAPATPAPATPAPATSAPEPFVPPLSTNEQTPITSNEGAQEESVEQAMFDARQGTDQRGGSFTPLSKLNAINNYLKYKNKYIELKNNLN